MDKYQPLFVALGGPAAGCIIAMFTIYLVFRFLERRDETFSSAVKEIATQSVLQTELLKLCVAGHGQTLAAVKAGDDRLREAIQEDVATPLVRLEATMRNRSVARN